MASDNNDRDVDGVPFRFCERIAEEFNVPIPPEPKPVGKLVVQAGDEDEFDWNGEVFDDDALLVKPSVPDIDISEAYAMQPMQLKAYLRKQLAETVYSSEFGCNVVSKFETMLQGVLFDKCLTPSGWTIGEHGSLDCMLELSHLAGLHARTALENMKPLGSQEMAKKAVVLCLYYALLLQLASPTSSRPASDDDVFRTTEKDGKEATDGTDPQR